MRSVLVATSLTTQTDGYTILSSFDFPFDFAGDDQRTVAKLILQAYPSLGIMKSFELAFASQESQSQRRRCRGNTTRQKNIVRVCKQLAVIVSLVGMRY